MNHETIALFVSAFLLSGLGGLAALLRSSKELTKLNVTSSFLNSGILGLGISLIWYARFQDNLYFLVGICIVAGLGGMTTVDFILAAIRKGGFSVNIGKEGIAKLPKEEEEQK